MLRRRCIASSVREEEVDKTARPRGCVVADAVETFVQTAQTVSVTGVMPVAAVSLPLLPLFP